MRVAFFLLDVEKTFGAGAAGFIDGDQRLWRQLAPFRNARNQARHLISASTRASGDDKFNGLGWFPRPRCEQGQNKELNYQQEENMESQFHFVPSISFNVPGR